MAMLHITGIIYIIPIHGIVIELDRITDSNGKVLWIKHLGNKAYGVSSGWSKVDNMKMETDIAQYLDFPLFHYSIELINFIITNIDKSVVKSHDDNNDLVKAILERELVILSHLNLDTISLYGLSLDELKEKINGKDIVVIDTNRFSDMKKAYEQVNEIKRLLGENTDDVEQ